jgi:hypothetical protein
MEGLSPKDRVYVTAVAESLKQNPDVAIRPVAKLLVEELDLKVSAQTVDAKLKELVNAKA